MNSKTTSVQNKRLAAILLTAAAILSLPLIAMQLHADGVDWNLRDFIIMGVLLFGTGLACEAVLRKVKTTGKRLLFVGLILIALFLVWAELAVGIFGTPFAGS